MVLCKSSKLFTAEPSLSPMYAFLHRTDLSSLVVPSLLLSFVILERGPVFFPSCTWPIFAALSSHAPTGSGSCLLTAVGFNVLCRSFPVLRPVAHEEGFSALSFWLQAWSQATSGMWHPVLSCLTLNTFLSTLSLTHNFTFCAWCSFLELQ